ncbi:hypothetical protein [Phytohabitans aurantiacus]|uniref:HicB family protein n=1 Tax=Phytohabitans aurantiacus TaxID=3016789 RepID=A0ABQ5QTZ3_9ACTN|nr:hypothetical protein [Phytohabitans aurantiacus]GLH97381.1 hypothetical protein Pa4123_26560 [Phytohabitans aurantiacus]
MTDFSVPRTFTIPLAPCGEVFAGEDCGCGRTAEEVAAEVAAYEAWLAAQPVTTSPEATR